MMYLNGRFVSPDREKATHWLRLAAAQGFKRADTLLKKIESEDG